MTLPLRVFLLVSLVSRACSAAAPPPPPIAAPYHPDPNHLWNRLHRAIFIRTTADGTQLGDDALDPLLYAETKFLHAGESHRTFLATLEEFLAAAPDRHIDDPVKSAVLQRDLWAVFDWAQRGSPYQGNTSNPTLTRPLANAIRRLALTPEQIAGLPDTYAQALGSKQFPARHDPAKPAQPFLPDDLLAPDGPWVALADGDTFAARSHVTGFQGRTAFDVFLKLPGGRQATLDFLAALRAAKEPLVKRPPTPTDNRTLIVLNPNLPLPPKGTQVALVRRTLVIDRDARICSTPLIDSVQLRVLRGTPLAAARGDGHADAFRVEQDNFEFDRSRGLLFAGKAGGLRSVEPGEQEAPPPLFRAHLFDPLEQPDRTGRPPAKPPLHATLESCRACHGFQPFQTLEARFPAYPEDARMPQFTAIEANVFERDAAAVIAWKTQQKDWKALTELMKK